jgi:hypothetical protein
MRVNYSPKSERPDRSEAGMPAPEHASEHPLPASGPYIAGEAFTKLNLGGTDFPGGLIKGDPDTSHNPAYSIDYSEVREGQLSEIMQQSISADRDFYSDGGDGYAVLHHVEIGNSLANMIGVAQGFVPDLLVQPGKGIEFWTTAVTTHDEAMASGEAAGRDLAAGRYVNGHMREETPAGPPEMAPEKPLRPDRDDGHSSPGQVADLGGNTAHNQAIIADLNEAPSTLVVLGHYFETNAISQANVFQNEDHVVNAGSHPRDLDAGGNRADNVATFAAQELVAQGLSLSGAGDLHVQVDFVEGAFVDVKSLLQRNFIHDGDVAVQTRLDAYSQVLTGDNGQQNVTSYADWGKHYDIIIVLGDYHSANIISQVNILLDSDVVGLGNPGSEPGAGAGPVYTGQNALLNEAAINHYGATTFTGITGDLNDLIEALGNRENADRAAWSSLHGTASGNLNVLFVTGDYYDINVISQVNVIADADLAVQGGAGQADIQWLSTGANSTINSAEIISAGGIADQYLGGNHYVDSVLVQANLISDAAQSTSAEPTALVSEIVAFIGSPQDLSPAEGETWSWNTYSNHDSFGNVLT